MANNSTFYSNKKPLSSILKSTFVGRLSSLFGFRQTDKDKAQTDIGKQYGLDFVRVDLDNANYKFKNAALGSVFESHALSEKVERLFRAYMDDTTFAYDDIIDRQRRLNELTFLCDNNFFARRVVDLVGNEATQVSAQQRLLSCESPNLNFVNKVYELLNTWGVTAPRIQGVFRDLEEYGESFWVHIVGQAGIEKITPISVSSVVERLEFSPVHMSQYLAQRDGWTMLDRNRSEKIQKLVDLMSNQASMDVSDNLADMYDSKLFGFELEGGIIAPAWSVTHFRVDADSSNEFYPYGRPPLIGCLTPFKQALSASNLQALARQMSFPTTVYSVKGTEGMGPELAFEHVNNVREEYDNIGVSAASAGGEVYTVNTKMWVPEGLISMDVKSANVDINFIDDIEMYNDQVAIAAGVPKAYLDQEYGGFGNSGVSLKEQWKPFNDHIYKLQTVFLQGLGELIRLHFAITGEFDYNTPFVLSMRFPAEETDEAKRNARKDSLEMVSSIVEILQTSLGLEEGEPLPEDVMIDILSKYSFLDPTDVQRWMKLSSYLKPAKNGSEDAGEDEDFGFGEEDEDPGAPPPLPESKMKPEDLKVLKERKARYIELKKERLKELRTRYRESKDQIYFHFLESQHLSEFVKNGKGHCYYVPKINETSLLHDAISVLKDGRIDKRSRARLNECLATEVAEKMNEMEMDDIDPSEITEQQNIDSQIDTALKESE